MHRGMISRISSIPLLRSALVLGVLVGAMAGGTVVRGVLSRRGADRRDGIRPLDETVNVGLFGGSPVVTGTGTGGAGVPRVTVSSDSSVVLGAGTANVGHVDGQGTAGTPSGGVVSVQGVGGGTAVPVSFTPSSSGGYTSLYQHNLGALVLIAAGAHVVHTVWGINTQSSLPTYVGCYDSATTGGVTLGATRPIIEFELYQTGQVPPQLVDMQFLLGIVCAATTTENGATPSASGVQFFGNYL